MLLEVQTRLSLLPSLHIVGQLREPVRAITVIPTQFLLCHLLELRGRYRLPMALELLGIYLVPVLPRRLGHPPHLLVAQELSLGVGGKRVNFVLLVKGVTCAIEGKSPRAVVPGESLLCLKGYLADGLVEGPVCLLLEVNVVKGFPGILKIDCLCHLLAFAGPKFPATFGLPLETSTLLLLKLLLGSHEEGEAFVLFLANGELSAPGKYSVLFVLVVEVGVGISDVESEEGVGFIPASDQVKAIDRLPGLFWWPRFYPGLEHLLQLLGLDPVLFNFHDSIDDVASLRETLGPCYH